MNFTDMSMKELKKSDMLEDVPDQHVDKYIEARGTIQANNEELWSLLAMGLSPDVMELILEHEGYEFERTKTEEEAVMYTVKENGEEKGLELRNDFGFWQVHRLHRQEGDNFHWGGINYD